eukprot:5809916-Prymnesium_polylepis.1
MFFSAQDFLGTLGVLTLAVISQVETCPSKKSHDCTRLSGSTICLCAFAARAAAHQRAAAATGPRSAA